MKKFGILTSGGDAPGMNAVIRAAVRAAEAVEIEIIGIKRGYAGLISGDMAPLARQDVANIVHQGGSILESSRCAEFETPEGRKKAIATVSQHQLSGLILIGGDGTFRGATALAGEGGVNVIGVPSTIDNDVYGTDFTIGFDTAVSFAMEAIDRIRDTAQTFERVFFIEVMGHHTGFIALQAALAAGAEGLVIPEEPLNIDAICTNLQQGRELGNRSAVVVVAEAQKPGLSYQIAQEVGSRTGLETRVCVLGHLQRGGSPSAMDRVMASDLGAAAVEALAGQPRGVMVGLVGGELVYTPIAETWGKKKELNPRLRQLTGMLS